MTITVNDKEVAGLRDYLRAIEGACVGMGNLESFVLKHGREFRPVPHKFKRGPLRECFRNAALLALRDPSLIYCEGYAFSIIPVLHAWCLTPADEAIEVTWREPGTEYIGIPFDTDYLSDTLLRSGYYGLLDCPQLKWPIVRGAHLPERWLHKSYQQKINQQRP